MPEPYDGDDSVYNGYNPAANSSPGSLYSSSTDNQSSTKTPNTAVQSPVQSPIRFEQSRAQSPMAAPSTPESEPYDDVDPMYGVFIPPANYSPASLCSSGTDGDDDDDDDDDDDEDEGDRIGRTAPPSSPVSPSPFQHRRRGGASPVATGGAYNGPLATEHGVGSGNGLGPGYAIRQDRVDELYWGEVRRSG